MSKIVSVDVETTGLIPGFHEVWEIALVPLDSGREHIYHQFQPTDLPLSDSAALKIGRFYENFEWIGDPRLARDMLIDAVVIDDDEETESPAGHKAVVPATEACWRMAKELEGATILGLNPHFDAAHLETLLNKYGHSPAWNHRFLDLGSFAAGAWGAKNVLSGAAIAERMESRGIVNDGLHNAYADAKWNVDAYNAILDGVGA